MSRKSPPPRPDLPSDWTEFLSLLIAHRVRFLIVGGHAVAVHGQPRYTQDLDLFVEAAEKNGERLRAALLEFGLGSATPDAKTLATRGKVFMIGRLPLRIDLLTSISGVEFGDAWAARSALATSAGTVGVLSREHLLENKRAAGRPKDIADIALLNAAGDGAVKPSRRAVKRPTPKKPSRKR